MTQHWSTQVVGVEPAVSHGPLPTYPAPSDIKVEVPPGYWQALLADMALWPSVGSDSVEVEPVV